MKRYLTIGPLLLMLLIMPSCDNFLDENPDNRVELNTVDKAAQLLVSAYSSASYGFTEWMTDNSGFINGVALEQKHQQAYAWEDIFDNALDIDNPAFFWSQTYYAIAHANEVLAVIDDLPADNEEDVQLRDAVRAEALLARAYGHFMLVNMFAPHYDPLGNNTSLGVPYVTEPETELIGTYTRLSVEEVYTQVEQDMLAGLEGVDDGAYFGSGKYHFTRNAALAFAARYYLYKGDLDESLNYCNQMLGSSPGSFIRDLTSSAYQTAKGSIQGYPALYTSTEENANLMLMRKNSQLQSPGVGHGPTNDLYNDLFGLNPFAGATDERENPAFVKGINGLLPVRYQSLFERISLNSNSGFPYHIFIAFSGEEVLMNRMEILVSQNRIDEAIADLQVLVDRRYSGQPEVSMELLRIAFGVENDPTVSDQLVLSVYVQIERQKEFIWQGLRWFDIKRFDIPVQHALLDGTILTLEAEDNRKVLQIPVFAQESAGLEPNPR